MTKQEIDNLIIDNINTNNVGLITGLVLQQVLLHLADYSDNKSELMELFLSKLNADTAQGLIKFLSGAEFGEFSQGIHTGKGGRIDQFGRAELESLALRSFLEVPELRYNRQTIVGDEIAISDGGTIEDVWQHMDENEEPIDPNVFVLKLKLEEGEAIPFHTHDIIKGIYYQQGGFRTSWFRVIDTSAEDGTINVAMGNSESVPGGVNYPPVKYMNIARRGNFVDVERQSSIYISAKEGKIIMLDGVDNYMAGVRSFQIGKPSGLEDVVDFDKFTQIDQNQSYLYARGILVRDIIEVDAHGAPLRTKRDRGMWSIEVAESDEPYLFTDKYQDIAWVGANRYRCIVNETKQEPSETGTDWVLDLAIDVEAELPKMIEIIGPRILKNPDSGGETSISLEVVKHNFSGSVKWEFLYMSYWQVTPWFDDIVIDWDAHSSLFQNDLLQLRCSSVDDPSVYAITSIAVVRDGEDGQDGEPGESGAGILSVTDWYAISTNGTTAPSTGWQTAMPSKPANYYLWNYEVITYTDGRTPTQTQKRVIQGKDARSIYDIKNAYAYSTSDTVSPIGPWYWSISALGEKAPNEYLWVREDIAYTDDPSNYYSTIGYVVRDGEKGADGDGTQTIYTIGNTYPSTPSGDNPPGWVPYPLEPTPSQVYIFVSSRTKTDGTWGPWSSPTIYTRYTSDGADGEDGHSPYIDETTGTWWEWNDTTGQYEDTGYSPVGSDGAIPYPAGYYDNTKWYRREPEYAPYVQYGGTLYLLIKDTPNAGIPTTNTEYWKAFNQWEAVFISSLVAAYANIGGVVFTGNTSAVSSGIRGRILSAKGIDGTENYSSYTGDGSAWQPVTMLDFRTGAGHLAKRKFRWNENGDIEFEGASTGTMSRAIMSNGRIRIVTDWLQNEWEVLKAEAANIEDRTVSPPYPLKHVLRIKLDLPKNADSPQLSAGELYVDNNGFIKMKL